MAAGKVVVYSGGKMSKTSTGENATVDGHLVVTGNLTVSGDTITANVGTVNVEDKNMTLNYLDGDSSATANGAGITIQDAVDASTDATMLWNTTSDTFDFSHGIDVTGNITVSGTVDGVDIASLSTTVSGIDTAVPAIIDSSGTPAFNTGITKAEVLSILNVEDGADVTDATNVAAAGAVMTTDSDASSFSFVIAEDNLASDSDTKVPTQGSVKAYVDSQVSGSSLSSGTNITVSGGNINLDNDLDFSSGTIIGLQAVGTESIIQFFDLAETIAVGSVVCFTGNSTVSKSDNTNSAKDMAIGIAVDDGAHASSDYTVASDAIANSGNGVAVALAGSIINKVVWESGKEPTAVGQEIYMSTAGQATKDAPTSGAIYRLGYASYVDSGASPAVYKVLLQPGFLMDN